MLNMTQVIEASAAEDNKGFAGVCMVAAIFIARAVIGSEKMLVVRNEIKTCLEMAGETKVPKSTLNRYIDHGLTLARRLTYKPPEGAQDLRKARDFLATVAAEADQSNPVHGAAAKPDSVLTLANELKRNKVTIKLNGLPVLVHVTNANRIAKLLNKPAKAQTAVQQLKAAIARCERDAVAADSLKVNLAELTRITTLAAKAADAAAKAADEEAAKAAAERAAAIAAKAADEAAAKAAADADLLISQAAQRAADDKAAEEAAKAAKLAAKAAKAAKKEAAKLAA